MKILICDEFDPSLSQRLREFGEVTKDHKMLPEADIALVRSKTKCTREWLDKAAKLKLLIRGGVGLDNIPDIDYAKKKGIHVTNTPEASSIAVAELAMSLLLAIPNRLIKAHTEMPKWTKDYDLKKMCERTELYGKILGLIGIGRIGKEVAIRALRAGVSDYLRKPFNLEDLKDSLSRLVR
jgi:D-3-phosphoglycerate dehydrogenase